MGVSFLGKLIEVLMVSAYVSLMWFYLLVFPKISFGFLCEGIFTYNLVSMDS